jgi:hypothetical protein
MICFASNNFVGGNYRQALQAGHEPAVCGGLLGVIFTRHEACRGGEGGQRAKGCVGRGAGRGNSHH